MATVFVVLLFFVKKSKKSRLPRNTSFTSSSSSVVTMENAAYEVTRESQPSNTNQMHIYDTIDTTQCLVSPSSPDTIDMKQNIAYDTSADACDSK